MATAVYKVNYQGLKKRESYNEIVDYLENKQEKINYPNRFAKQIRNSPELSNLLDGEGIRSKGDWEPFFISQEYVFYKLKVCK